MMQAGAESTGYALEDAIPMRVDVMIEPGPDEASRAAFESRLRRLVRDLGDDLGIHLDLDLQVRPPDTDDLGSGQPYAVRIDGTPCRVDRTQGLAPDSQPVTLADAVLGTLFHNRAQLATPALVGSVCRTLAAGTAAVPAPERIRRVLEDAFERCFDVRTALELCRVALDGGNESDYEAELRAAMHFSKTIRIELGRGQYDAALKPAPDPEPGKERVVDDMAEMMRDGLYYELGIRFPPLELTFGEALDDGEFRIRINRLRGPVLRGLGPDEVLVNDTVDRLKLLNIEARATVNPANGSEVAVVPGEHAGVCEQAGLTTWDPAGYMILSTSAVLRRHASVFFTIAQMEYNLGRLDEAFPMLVFNVLERYSPVEVTGVMRGLLAEELSIRDLRSILEALLELNGTTDVAFDRYIVFTVREAHLAASPRPLDALTAEDIVEFVRSAMKRYISHKYTRGGNTLVIYLLDPEIEARLQDPAALDAPERNRLLEAVHDEIGTLPPSAQNPVILTIAGVRGRLRRELEQEYPRLAILSYLDLSPDLNVQPIARISLSP